MVETYKILNNIDEVQYEQILPLGQTTTRGHSKKLYKKNCRTKLMLGNIASHKELWMSGIKYQRK
jgi:hypothetical protein